MFRLARFFIFNFIVLCLAVYYVYTHYGNKPPEVDAAKLEKKAEKLISDMKDSEMANDLKEKAVEKLLSLKDDALEKAGEKAEK